MKYEYNKEILLVGLHEKEQGERDETTGMAKGCEYQAWQERCEYQV